MAINATKGGVDRDLIPPGNYSARCYSVIHIGTIEDTWKGEKKYMNKVRFAWEIPELMITFDNAKGPQPMSISKEYTLSTGKKANLRAMLQSWRGQDFTDQEAECFDVTRVAGAACMINIIHKIPQNGGNPYEEVVSVSKMPTGLKCPPQINSMVIWDYDKFDTILLECLPSYVRDKIKTSKEYKAKTDPTNVDTGSAGPVDNPEDDLPF